MKLVKNGEGQPYEAKGHFSVWSSRKLEAGKDSKKLSISLSHFLPQGGTEMSSSNQERVYFVISGRMSIKGEKQGEQFVLEPGDTLYIAAGEKREVRVVGTEPATILVAMVNGD